MEPLLRVSDLVVRLDGQIVLKGINFEIKPKETLVILGPNGAGKTILLKAILGLVASTGRIDWKKGTRVGYVPQRISINRDLPITVQDFFELKKLEHRAIRTALSQVGLSSDKFLTQRIGILSSGQLQRVLIAWALADDPDLLIFDEPNAGIDVAGQETIQELLRRIHEQKQISIILVTHDLTAVYSQATNVLCINQKTFCYGPPTEILTPKMMRDIYGVDLKYFRHLHD